MPFTHEIYARRSLTSVRRQQPIATRAIPLRPAGGEKLAPALPHDDAPRQTLSTLTVKAAAAFSHCAANAFPNLMLAVLSWAIAEVLAGCAAYAEALYPVPAPDRPVTVPVERARDTSVSRMAKPGLSLIAMQAEGGSAGPDRPRSRSVVRAVILPASWPRETQAPRTGRSISLKAVASACWLGLCRAGARRRAVEELRNMSDRDLRDIGICRCDIEHIVRYGVRPE